MNFTNSLKLNPKKIHNVFQKHFEWIVFSIALILIIAMNPYINQGASFCLFERAGITFCPGEGLAHSIAYFFRGDVSNALEANLLGPVAFFVLAFRIGYLIYQNIFNSTK